MKTPEHARNILIAVDVQNDFIDGTLAVPHGDEVIPPLNDIASAVRGSDGTVIFTRDWHPATTPHFETWPTHCVANTRGAGFHSALDIRPDDTFIYKGTEQTNGYSGWEGMSENGGTIETIVSPLGAEEKVRVFIGGLATDYCVKATTLDVAGHFKDDNRVATYILRDAIRAVGLRPTDNEEALRAMRDAGAVAISCEEARIMIEKGA